MINRNLQAIAFFFLFVSTITGCSTSEQSDDLELWYDAPARFWRESMPIGNGRIATMIAGNIYSDTLVMNEETMWSGGINEYSNPEAKAHLDEIRQLILDEKYDEALALGDKYMIGKPRNQQYYQYIGKLYFDFNHKGEISNYRRSLNMNSAIANVSYECDGYQYKREYFASHPDNVIMMKLTTNNPEGLDFTLRHTSELESEGRFEEGKYILTGKNDDARGIDGMIRFESRIQVHNNAKISPVSNGFSVQGEKELILAYTAETNYKNYKDVSGNPKALCDEILSQIEEKFYISMKEAHVADFSALFNRLEFNLGEEDSPLKDIPTDQLIDLGRTDSIVPYMDMMFYQMGRYLTISASRPGTQPMNLQGVWNENSAAPWGSKWTLNINAELNYWLAEGANLAECHEPLLDLLYDLYETGKEVAKVHYGCRGFVAHHNTDLWRGAAPVDGANWGLWTFGGAWLTRHLWEHYQYSQDEGFLKKAYPYLKEASLFFFDFLIEGNQGYLVTAPTVSFEQTWRRTDGRIGRLCEGPTMDNQILRDLFTNCYRAAEIVNDDPVFRDSLMYYKNRLKPTTIDEPTGQIMEWAWPAFQKNISGQVAPLWGVSPGYEINFIETPELAEAAVKTLRARDPYIAKYETTGSWVSGTRTNFWARLHMGDEVYRVYKQTIHENSFNNLWTSFYTKKYFQIDCSMGMAASFNEMLVQSQRTNKNGETIIDLLPALTSAWPKGSIKGVRARGGFELDIEWENGALKSAIIHSKAGKPCELLYKGTSKKIHLAKGDSFTWEL